MSKEHANYPKMLYRAGKGEGNMVWKERVDTLIVKSSTEEHSAIKDGWKTDPTKAVAKAKRRKSILSFTKWLVSHWQFWLMFFVAVAGVIATIIAGGG